MTKAEKRKLKNKDQGIVDFIKVVKHFFKNLNQWIEEMTDPRHPSYSIYTQNDLILMGVTKDLTIKKTDYIIFVI